MWFSKQVIKYKSVLTGFKKPLPPAETMIPKWFENMQTWANGKPQIIPEFTATGKNCSPFADTFEMGYLLTLGCDIVVEERDGDPYLSWDYGYKGSIEPLGVRRTKLMDKMPTSPEFDSAEWYWKLPTVFKIPVGYSVLITHPLNRYELPFVTMSAVIDGGYAPYPGTEIPFFLKKDFRGVIDQGTPIAQVIPFKSQNWTSQETDDLVDEGNLNFKNTNSLLLGWYKKIFWNKKSYK